MVPHDPHADLILTNGHIYTFDPQQPRARAIALGGGRVLASGSEARVLELRGPKTEVIPLRGRAVLPGLTDAHIHFTGFAMGLGQVDLEGARSAEEAAARVAARVQTAAAGEWIRGHSWNHNEWATAQFPHKGILDTVAPDHPVALTRKDGHSMWVNSAALAARGITRDTPDPEGGHIEKDSDGEPNGILREKAMGLMDIGIGVGTEEVPLSVLRRAIAVAHRLGLTTIHNIEGGPALRAFQELRRRGELTLRVAHFLPAEQLEAAIALGLEQGWGDEWLQLAGVKIFADGSLGSQTAAMFEPYAGTNNCGMFITPPDEIERLARRAAGHGLMVAVHAIGDRAIRAVLDIFEKLRREGLHEAGFRVEHAQHLNREDVPRFGRWNVLASMQPIHQPSDMAVADRLLGPRARFTYAFKSLKKAGANLAFGSDCPVETMDPLRGIHAAVTRQNERGEPAGGWYPEEKLTVIEAVRSYLTPLPSCLPFRRADSEAAENGESRLGPDWIVLSQNIFDLPPEEIPNTRIDYTISGGQVVYRGEP